MFILRRFVGVFIIWLVVAPAGYAADRDKVEAFMKVTGFDMALASLRVSAKDAPAMLGMDAADFGLSWTLLADDIFEPEAIKADAIEILERTLRDDVLVHAAAFYASDLGQRLVAAENESHFEDSADKNALGQELAAALMERNSPQPQYFVDMSDAIGTIDTGIQAYREVQVRFLMAAMAAGLFERDISEEQLRLMLAEDDAEMRSAIAANLVASNAYTYRSFSDQDMKDYLEALKTPEMKEVYELMNAVQYTIMANRYEALAARMAKLHPSQDL